jgi:HAD superfamily hydrolase (TIGR01509 family)
MAINALFFDVGNTLLFPNRQKMLVALHARNVFPAEELLRRVECETKHEFDGLMESHAAVDHGFWYIFYTRLLDELGIADESVRNDLVARTRISANWCDIRPGTREALLALGRKYRVGVISNADGRIADVLAKCGIADCFESITDSGIVGKEKPHPEIIESAIKSLDVEASESLYIGDIFSVDYAGATAVGMQAVLFDACGAYKTSGPPTLESLDELEMMLDEVAEPE